jgi:very-short-patch-repair endonuclease
VRDPRLIEFAKIMRREMTEPERRLWYQVRAKRLNGIKFRRQQVIGRYIADFYSREVALIIEVDGDTHAFQQEYDRVREKYFKGLGYRVVRFINSDVMRNLEGVMRAIGEVVTPPLPTLSPEGKRAQ